MNDLESQLASARSRRDKLSKRLNTKHARATFTRATMDRLYDQLLRLEAEIRYLRTAMTNPRTRRVVYRKAPDAP